MVKSLTVPFNRRKPLAFIQHFKVAVYLACACEQIGPGQIADLSLRGNLYVERIAASVIGRGGGFCGRAAGEVSCQP